MKTQTFAHVLVLGLGFVTACSSQTDGPVSDLSVPEPPIDVAITPAQVESETALETAETESEVEAFTEPVTMVGTWGTTLEQCSNYQEVMDAPLILTMEGLDQHEAHCTFDLVVQLAPNSWQVEGSCSVEGYEEAMEMIYTVEGDQLIQSFDGYEWPPLLRCP